MKVRVLQENLVKALTVASRFVSPKVQLPVLGNIFLFSKKTKLQVASTNLETSISITVPADSLQDGQITVPGKAITELITNLQAGTLTLEGEKEQLRISAANFESTLTGMNASDFPPVPSVIGKEESLILPKNLFLNAISQVSFATSTDETRPILTGVLFIFQKNQIIFVATDGFRLSQKKMKTKVSPKIEKLILPRGTIVEVSRIIAENEEILMAFNPNQNQVLFGNEGMVLSSRILEGEFPDFEKIIPKETITEILLDKEDFLRAIKLASVFARDAGNVVKIKGGRSFVDIFAESSSSGNQTTRIDAKIEGEEKIEIAFNYRFLEEFLHAISGEAAKIGLSNSSSPGVFTDPSDPDFLHLIMPVRIQE